MGKPATFYFLKPFFIQPNILCIRVAVVFAIFFFCTKHRALVFPTKGTFIRVNIYFIYKNYIKDLCMSLYIYICAVYKLLHFYM